MLIVLIIDSVAGIMVAPGKRSLTSSFSVMELEMNELDVCRDRSCLITDAHGSPCWVPSAAP